MRLAFAPCMLNASRSISRRIIAWTAPGKLQRWSPKYFGAASPAVARGRRIWWWKARSLPGGPGGIDGSVETKNIAKGRVAALNRRCFDLHGFCARGDEDGRRGQRRQHGLHARQGKTDRSTGWPDRGQRTV